MAHLQIQKGSDTRRIDLDKDIMAIGRSPDCDVVLDARGVSRHHAQVVRDGERYLLEDLNSHNGTYLNGGRVTKQTPLGDGDRIKIGEFVLEFHSDKPNLDETVAEGVIVTDQGDARTVIVSSRDAASLDGLTHLVPAVRPEAKLRAVFEISRDLGAAFDLDVLLPRILDSLLNVFPQADGGCILLQDKSSQAWVPRALKHRRPSDGGSLHVSRTIINVVVQNGRAVLSQDASSDQRFQPSMSIVGHRIRSVMCAPLMNRSRAVLGVIQIHTEDVLRQFKQEDLDLLVSVAATAAIALENAHLHQDFLAQDRLRRELQFARDVQQAFLPQKTPSLAGYQFYACYEPAHSVGGDYYGFIELPDDRLAISIGDVSGKGMPAALLMAHLASDIRFSAISAYDPAAVVRSVNASLSEAGLGGRFVTLLFAVLDKMRHSLTIVNAGHLPPLVRTPAGTIEEIGPEATGLPLNVNLGPPEDYCAFTVPVEPGSTVLLYTDGLTEAKNSGGDFFGIERLKEVFKDAPASVAEAGDAIVHAIRNFTSGQDQHDDITLICFSRGCVATRRAS